MLIVSTKLPEKSQNLTYHTTEPQFFSSLKVKLKFLPTKLKKKKKELGNELPYTYCAPRYLQLVLYLGTRENAISQTCFLLLNSTRRLTH